MTWLPGLLSAKYRLGRKATPINLNLDSWNVQWLHFFFNYETQKYKRMFTVHFNWPCPKLEVLIILLPFMDPSVDLRRTTPEGDALVSAAFPDSAEGSPLQPS